VAIDELLAPVTEYFKGKKYWPAIQPIFALLSLYVAACVLGYEYLQSQYSLVPLQVGNTRVSLVNLFFHSYLFKQLSIAAATVGIIGLLFKIIDTRTSKTKSTTWTRALKTYSVPLARRGAVVLFVLAIVVPIFWSFTPPDVGNIRVVFLQDPNDEYDQSAFVYLLYELNARQSRWHFDVDFDVYNKNAHVDDVAACEGEPIWFCLAEREAAGRPLIAFTTAPLGRDHFWQNRKAVSVITTADWKPYVPPSMYEYLVYSAIAQSMLIHLNTACSGLPSSTFDERSVGFGDLFEFTPRRYAMKPAILAAHISPVQEVMLLNCFGAGYVNDVASLITLGWLHADDVTKKLKLSFGVSLDEGDRKPS
jgi:hypothetical protein